MGSFHGLYSEDLDDASEGDTKIQAIRRELHGVGEHTLHLSTV